MFIFAISIPNEEYMTTSKFNQGKYWTENEIDLNLKKNVFSKAFESEYEFLKTVVFPAEKLMHNV